jgi:hypothetical protein
MTTEPEVQRRGVDQMSPDERDRYFQQIEAFLHEGKTHAWIQRHFGLNRATARRHIARVQGRLEAEQSGSALAVREEVYPVALGKPSRNRAVPDALVGSDGKPIQLQGRRQTLQPGMLRLNSIMPPPEGGDWRLENVSPDELRRMAPADLILRMIRVSPEMARAHYDFLRMANPGHDLKAVKPGTDTPDDGAQEWLNYFEKRLSMRRGSADVCYNEMLTNLFVRGASLSELVLGSDVRTFVDIVTPDAYTARFKVINDAEAGGQTWQLGQGEGRNFVALDRPTIKYMAVDKLPGIPYGTSPIIPGLFPALFIITMLQDARRVVAQQGWPRLDIMVSVEQIMATMKPEDRTKPEAVQAWVRRAVEQIAESYSQLDPDQAWVHSDTVTFGTPIGAIGNLEGVAPLFTLLERMAVRALKSMPLLFGMPEGVSEANANRQWEVHVAGVRSLQRLAEEALSQHFTLALEANGVAAEAKFKFHELRATEELRDAQTLLQKLQVAQLAELLGYWLHDEASMYAVGQPAAETPIGAVGDEEDQPEEDETAENTDTPEDEAPGATDNDDDVTGDDGADRLIDSLARGVLGTPEGFMAVAYGMALASGRLVPKLKPKGTPKASGTETVTVGTADVRAAQADWNYRMPDYDGILAAEPIDSATD